MSRIIFFIYLFLFTNMIMGQKLRARDYNIPFGILPTGKLNAITDVSGVKVGHVTKIEGECIRTGVTAILPYDGNVFQNKVPAAVFVGNGFGKLAGSTQIKELGTLESPVILTNTLSVAAGMQGIIQYTLDLPGNEKVKSLNAVVGETNDGYLNDIRGMHIRSSDVVQAIRNATSGPVDEGNVGAGTGTVCFGWKGGIGSASRKLPESLGGYTVGVLVQTNFGGNLQIAGMPAGKILGKYSFQDNLKNADGSCMIVVATDAPVLERNLERIAQRAMMGLAKTGGIASNGSGDYVIAFSTAENLRQAHQTKKLELNTVAVLNNNDMSQLFLATIEATEEAIINSLFAAETMTGVDGNIVEKIPVDKIILWFSKK
ncbi:MAG: P1 family peptidase [Saprospiraceae bacterium]|nr:P1 family peptidase [Saprospiraceae bacterium]